jgi:SAM-dependent methyltransferase
MHSPTNLSKLPEFLSPGRNQVAIHATLIAVPIVVLVLTVFFNPSPTKGFFATLTSKPEWYFIALVFCVEALLDCLRIKQKAYENVFDGRTGWALVRTITAAVLAGLAMHATLSNTVINSPLSPAVPGVLGFLAAIFQNSSLHIAAIPFFFFCSLFYATTKFKLIEIEKEEDDNNNLWHNARRPRMYTVDRPGRVRCFYDIIAAVYTERNRMTKGIRHAQDSVVDTIRNSIKASRLDKFRVLDIGGGTGYGAFNLLRKEEKLDWTSLDISPRMTDKFAENFGGGIAITGDCLDLGNKIYSAKAEKYSVIVISFALSSMPSNVNFGKLSSILEDDGLVLIADIHPGYISKSPYFDVDVDNRTYALTLRKVEPLILEDEASAKFRRISWKIFNNERGEVYSFYLGFKKI